LQQVCGDLVEHGDELVAPVGDAGPVRQQNEGEQAKSSKPMLASPNASRCVVNSMRR